MSCARRSSTMKPKCSCGETSQGRVSSARARILQPAASAATGSSVQVSTRAAPLRCSSPSSSANTRREVGWKAHAGDALERHRVLVERHSRCVPPRPSVPRPGRAGFQDVGRDPRLELQVQVGGVVNRLVLQVAHQVGGVGVRPGAVQSAHGQAGGAGASSSSRHSWMPSRKFCSSEASAPSPRQRSRRSGSAPSGSPGRCRRCQHPRAEAHQLVGRRSMQLGGDAHPESIQGMDIARAGH